MSSPCARCSKVLGSSCCEVKDGEQLATLTWADADRIGVASTEWEWLTDDQAARWSLLHVAWGRYFGPWTRRLTLKRKDGRCVFLGARGCTLTEDERPTACRLYPFEVRAQGDWGLQVDRFGGVAAARASGEHACLAIEEGDSYDALFAAFDTSRAALEALHARLRAEAVDHARREAASGSEASSASEDMGAERRQRARDRQRRS